MKNKCVMEAEFASDATLVQSSLAGDREAFGQIVARYQSAICALAYSACGNLARSEDLAQEIFLTAWRKLGSLQEPAKLRSWLYGIARHLIQNAFRQHARNPVAGADSLEDAAEPACPVEEPDEQAISKEEETIMWHVLSGLPQIYREPMVLFYRQNEAISQVAETLAISEEAVRQRLSRGRAMLNERVTKVIQSGLRRSAPTDAFTVMVIGGLPMLAAATTTNGAIVGMATTKGATGQATGLLGSLKSLAFFAGLVAIPAALGGYLGHKLGQDAAGLPPQHKSAAKFWRVFGLGAVLFILLPLLLTFGLTGFLQGESRARFLSLMTWWLAMAYPFVLGALGFWAWQRRRTPSATTPSVPAGQSDATPHSIPGPAGYPARRISTRLVAFMTLAAAALLLFCFLDMNHNVGHPKPAELRDLITQNAPADLRVSILESHYRSLWGESPDLYRIFWIEVSKEGRTARYSAEVDEATLALLAQKGIPCPAYVQGRDFEVLGAPGRFLPFLAAFVLGMGALFLFKRIRRGARGANA